MILKIYNFIRISSTRAIRPEYERRLLCIWELPKELTGKTTDITKLTKTSWLVQHCEALVQDTFPELFLQRVSVTNSDDIIISQYQKMRAPKFGIDFI